MARISAIIAVLSCLTLSFVSIAAAEPSKVGVLQHFVSLPAGLDAEGLAIRNNHFYVGTIDFTAKDGTILILDRQGTTTQTITVPGLPLVGQLAFSDDNTLYAVAGNLNTGMGAVIRVHLDTGTVTTFATGFKLANGLAIDKEGNLFVTDLVAGTVSKVTPEGDVSIFASGPLLATALVPALGLSLGPNDLAFNAKETALYVTDLGLGTVVRIGVQSDGTAGPVTNFAKVSLPDGIPFDIKANMYVTIPLTNTVQLVAKDGSAHQVSFDTAHETLSNPSNVAFVGPELYITNLGLTGTSGISQVRVQFPGLPLEGEVPNYQVNRFSPNTVSQPR